MIKKRKFVNLMMLILCTLMAAYGFLWLLWILGTLVSEGLKYLTIDLVKLDPNPPGIEGGGLRPAFIGHLIITAIATLLGVPIGVLAGIFLSEYGEDSKFLSLLRLITDTMVSVPSIIVGAVVYAILVKPVGHFNGFAGAVSLAIIMTPIIAITTNEILRMIPKELREAAFALGAYKWEVTFKVVLRASKIGVITSVFMGIARIIGETAPLLFTSFNNNYLNLDPSKPMASLTVTIFNYVMGPYEYWHHQAWASALILTLTVLTISTLAKILSKSKGVKQ